MNKRSLLLSALLCAGTLANAQVHRLKAMATHLWHSNAFVKQDSSAYTYSLGRALINSETPSHERWAGDDILHMYFNMNGQQASSARTLQYFDNVDRVTRSYSLLWSNNTWDSSSKYTYHYDNSGLDTFDIAYVNSGNWMPQQRTVNVWGQSGIVTIYQQSWNPNINEYVNNIRITYTYASGKKEQEFGDQWNGTAWEPISRSTHTYAGNDLATTLQEGYNNGSWINAYSWHYTYDGNGDMTEDIQQQWLNGSWNNSVKHMSTYNNDHSKTQEISQLWNNNQWVNTLRRVFTYTSFNMIETSANTNWDANAGLFLPAEDQSMRMSYYYEEFDPASVNNTAKNNTALQAFPNPASNTLNIQSFTEQASPFSITIFDATGKSVKHWNEAPTSFYQKQIDVSNLPSGSYFLRISDRPQEAVQFTIVK